jgi:copper transport protein
MVIVGSVAVLPVSSANAQDLHHESHSAEIPIDLQGLAVGIAHGATLGAAVFLAGLVMFMVLVWLPTSTEEDADHRKAIKLFCRWMWMLVGLLVVSGLVEVPLYAVRASGEDLSPGLLVEALFDTRVGQLWIERIMLSILTVTVATYGANLRRRPGYMASLRRSAYMANLRHSAYLWGAAVAMGTLLLLTLTQQSHAAAEGSFLPFAADWLHVIAASLWMGGLLGFPILLLGPLRTMPTEARSKLLGRVVPRFSNVATMAVMSLILTGLVAILLHVPSVSALFSTSYGRALTIKLGLVVLLLAIGGLNLIARGQGPFGRMVGAELILALGVFVATGFLTSLPPADVAEQEIVEHNIPNPTQDIRPPPLPSPPAFLNVL